jgi:hypothetical protein
MTIDRRSILAGFASLPVVSRIAQVEAGDIPLSTHPFLGVQPFRREYGKFHLAARIFDGVGTATMIRREAVPPVRYRTLLKAEGAAITSVMEDTSGRLIDVAANPAVGNNVAIKRVVVEIADRVRADYRKVLLIRESDVSLLNRDLFFVEAGNGFIAAEGRRIAHWRQIGRMFNTVDVWTTRTPPEGLAEGTAIVAHKTGQMNVAGVVGKDGRDFALAMREASPAFIGSAVDYLGRVALT